MEKRYIAIGDFYNEEGIQLAPVPSDPEEVFAKVEEIMLNYTAGTVLTDEQLATLRSCLPAIGCDEPSRDENGSLQGKGKVMKNSSGAGLDVDSIGNLSVETVWEQYHDRKQWIGNMELKRIGGDATVKELKFEFFFLSIGQDASGNFVILYNEYYNRVFNDPIHLEDFNDGGTAQASRIDISKHIQWGFYMHAKCTILTDAGSLII